MTAEKPYELGLLISRHFDVCNEVKITVSVVHKSDDGRSIKNLGQLYYNDERLGKAHHGRRYDDFVMAGQVYQGVDRREWIAYEPRYRNAYQIDRRDAEAILKTFRAFESACKRWRKANGHEISHGAMLAIFAKFVGAKFVAYQDYTDKGRRQTSTYKEMEWDFLTVGQGVNKYVHEIARLVEEWVDPWKPRLVHSA